MSDGVKKLAAAKAAGWSEWIRGPADEQAVSEGCVFDLVSAPASFNHHRGLR